MTVAVKQCQVSKRVKRMGCSAPGGFKLASLFGRRGGNGGSGGGSGGSGDAADGGSQQRARLEHKLWLAREAPSPTFELADLGLRRVPPGVYALCRVLRKEALLLQGNRLDTLHALDNRLADLRLLRALDLSRNRLDKLPADIGLLESLRELRLSENRLVNLPEQLGLLTQLQHLDVSHNHLKCIPPALGKLLKLSVLSLLGNNTLKTLPKELCNAVNLKTIELDHDKFVYPPEEISEGGTEQIMKFLCKESDIEYVKPTEIGDLSPISNNQYVLSPIERDPALKNCMNEWEARDERLQQLENEVHEASKRQRQRFLDDFTKEQKKIDGELNKIQQEKDVERANLIDRIRLDEEVTVQAVDSLLRMGLSNPLLVQEYLDRDREERDRLLEMCRKNYIDLKKTDTLKAMEDLLHEEGEREKTFRIYGESQNEATRSFLLRELDIDNKLGGLLKTREMMQSDLVDELLEDENLQKAAVGLLLERCDARSWGLVQEINLVESHLAKLSAIELDRRKLEWNDNLDGLADQRIKLSVLLVDLLDRRETRRSQLVDTLRAMELERETSSDFWLIQYQQLLDTLPDKIVTSQRQLDPLLANYLLGEGVIHCLPFLITRDSSKEDLALLTDDLLKDRGIRLTADRVSVLKAIKLYLEESDASNVKIANSPTTAETRPSAPLAESADNAEISNRESECIVCMDSVCEIVFIPCGHLCCCDKCSGSVEKLCPMCRGEIERRIRVIQP